MALRLVGSRSSCLIALIVVALAAFGVSLPVAAQISGTQQKLLLTVLDDQGAPMKALRTEQFIVLEDGEARPVTASRVATEPQSIVLMIDMTQPVFGQTLNVRDIRTAVSSFITTVHTAQPETRIQLVEVAGAPSVRVTFTNDTEELVKSAERLFQNQQGDGPMIEALVDAARDLSEEKSVRRAIISVDRDSPDPSRVRPEDVMDAMQASGASVWSVSIRESGRGSAAREEMLSFLTEETGGTLQTARVLTPLESMLGRIAEALTHQYVVTYTRPNGATVTDILAGTSTAGKVLMGELAER